MTTLFPIVPVFPEGFSYFPDFLNEAEEQELLALLAGVELHTLIFQGFEAKRKVESFGYDYNFDSRQISKGEPIPSGFAFLVEKVANFVSVPSASLAEMLLTEYPEGSVINWHRDAPPFKMVIGISLLSDCNFRMRPYDKSKRTRNAILSLPVKRRSLYILNEDARSRWEHSISPVKEKRYSITFRTLKTSADFS